MYKDVLNNHINLQMVSGSSVEDSEAVLSAGIQKKSKDDMMLAFMQSMSENIKKNVDSIRALSQRRKRDSSSSDEGRSDTVSREPARKITKPSARSSVHPRGLTQEACSVARSEGERLPERLSGLMEGPQGEQELTNNELGQLTNPLAKGGSRSNPAKGKGLGTDSKRPTAVEDGPQLNECAALESLEQLLNEEEEQAGEEELEFGFPILGGIDPPTWYLSKEVLRWYKTVADIDLEKESLKDINEQYKSKEELVEHFRPPKLPEPLWSSMKSTSNAFRQKVIFQAQEYLVTALKPQLSMLEKCSDGQKEKLTTAIQLICTSNLQLNRFRRVSAGTYIKKDIRKSITSLPVVHNALFGTNF